MTTGVRSGATDVLVLEQFALGHGRGAYGDHSRITHRSGAARVDSPNRNP